MVYDLKQWFYNHSLKIKNYNYDTCKKQSREPGYFI